MEGLPPDPGKESRKAKEVKLPWKAFLRIQTCKFHFQGLFILSLSFSYALRYIRLYFSSSVLFRHYKGFLEFQGRLFFSSLLPFSIPVICNNKNMHS
ncbi:predicted protein [Methanosarcina acetivorans C2A]|uniref:Uncharacterized protein n=1 Tax=Methanosarcina acetivorans (strain ATCC 35395 / DSM 2834 / JCM 12185 / C2A) TaxID=188937 RepID=Q8TIL7_METAC|nr:predicted protein [Methanosarcina acetivorans C2A]